MADFSVDKLRSSPPGTHPNREVQEEGPTRGLQGGLGYD